MKKKHKDRERTCKSCGGPMIKIATKKGGVYKRRREVWVCTICPFSESIENETIEE